MGLQEEAQRQEREDEDSLVKPKKNRMGMQSLGAVEKREDPPAGWFPTPIDSEVFPRPTPKKTGRMDIKLSTESVGGAVTAVQQAPDRHRFREESEGSGEDDGDEEAATGPEAQVLAALKAHRQAKAKAAPK